MSNDFDLYLKNMKKTSSDSLMAIITVLPVLSLLKKMMARKQLGKKKFSSAFAYEEKKQSMDKAETFFQQELEDKQINFEASIALLRGLADTAMKAAEEISLTSLKKDYLYFAGVFLDSATFLYDVNSKELIS